MSKKRKKRQHKRKVKANQAPMSPDARGAQAAAYLDDGKVKKALEIYKSLYKNDSPEKWRDPLIIAYKAWIEELAVKGLNKEALALSDYLHKNFGVLDSSLRISIELRAGRYVQAAAFYAECSSDMVDGSFRKIIEALFAMAALAGQEDILRNSLPDSLLVRHFPHASEALNSYCAGDYEAVADSLKQISFRSPYRDFSLIIKGLIALESHNDQTEALFARVSETSPFASFARICQTAQLPSAQFFASVKKREGIELRLLGHLNSMSSRRMLLIQQLAATNSRPSKLYAFCSGKLRKIDKAVAEKYCFSLLPYCSGNINVFSRTFKELQSLDVMRIEALENERLGYQRDAADRWHEYLKVLKKQPETEMRDLDIALVLRHIVDIMPRDPRVLSAERVELLEESLEFDPKDSDVWLQLHAERSLSDKRRYQIIDEALDHFPNNLELLFQAAEAAANRGVYKKASRFAARILEIDPINVKVKFIIVDAHLGHAKKLILGQKYALAEKELKLAISQERQGKESGKVQIYQGILAKFTGNEEQAEISFNEGVNFAGSPVLGWAMVVVAGLEFSLTFKQRKKIDQAFKAAIKKGLTKNDILALVAFLHKYPVKQRSVVRHLLGLLGAKLTKGAALDYSIEEYYSICSFLEDLRKLKELKKFSMQGLKKFQDDPRLIYFKYYVILDGGMLSPNPKQFADIDDAIYVAKQSDPQLAQALISLIDNPFDDFEDDFDDYFGDDDFDDDFDDDEFDDEDLDDEDFAHIFQELQRAGMPYPKSPEDVMKFMNELMNKGKGPEIKEPVLPQLDPKKSFLDQDEELLERLHREHEERKKKKPKPESDSGPQRKLF